MESVGQTSLLVVRHGQSTWNVEHRWQGQADPPLSERGRQQAHTAAASIGTVDAIVSSPQIRAMETAAIIGTHLGVGPIQTLDDLRERSAGEWSGLTTVEIEEKWPGWIDSPKRPDGWEEDHQLLARILPAFVRIGAEFPEATVLVICHGGVIVALEQHLAVNEQRTPNLHGRLLAVRDEELIPGERIELLPPELSTGGTGGRV